jgi:hypothetical protein
VGARGFPATVLYPAAVLGRRGGRLSGTRHPDTSRERVWRAEEMELVTEPVVTVTGAMLTAIRSRIDPKLTQVGGGCRVAVPRTVGVLRYDRRCSLRHGSTADKRDIAGNGDAPPRAVTGAETGEPARTVARPPRG